MKTKEQPLDKATAQDKLNRHEERRTVQESGNDRTGQAGLNDSADNKDRTAVRKQEDKPRRQPTKSGRYSRNDTGGYKGF